MIKDPTRTVDTKIAVLKPKWTCYVSKLCPNFNLFLFSFSAIFMVWLIFIIVYTETMTLMEFAFWLFMGILISKSSK